MIRLTQKVTHTHKVDRQLVGDEAFEWLAELSKLPLQKAAALVISMERVRAVDATGIAALVRLHGYLASRGGELVLEQVDPSLTRRLVGMGLNLAVPIHSTATPVPVAAPTRARRSLA